MRIVRRSMGGGLGGEGVREVDAGGREWWKRLWWWWRRGGGGGGRDLVGEGLREEARVEATIALARESMERCVVREWVEREGVESLLGWRGMGCGGGLERVVFKRAGLAEGLVERLRGEGRVVPDEG